MYTQYKDTTRQAVQRQVISLNEDLGRSAQLPVNSLVCRYHLDEIHKRNHRCSCPRENHSDKLHKHNIPKRLYTVFDSVGANTPSYKPGSRWCNNCKDNAELSFRTHPLYEPPRKRTPNKVCFLFYFYLLLGIKAVAYKPYFTNE